MRNQRMASQLMASRPMHRQCQLVLKGCQALDSRHPLGRLYMVSRLGMRSLPYKGSQYMGSRQHMGSRQRIHPDTGNHLYMGNRQDTGNHQFMGSLPCMPNRLSTSRIMRQEESVLAPLRSRRVQLAWWVV